MHVEEQQLRAFISDSGLVSKRDIEEALLDARATRSTLADTLISRGKLSEDDLRKVKARLLGVPFVDLRGEKIDFSVLSLVPEPIARAHGVVAFRRGDDSIEVAALDLSDLKTIDFIREKAGVRVVPRITSAESMKSALLQYQRGLKSEFGDLIKRESAALDPLASDPKKMSDELPVIRIVDTLLKHAVVQSASDIHIEPSEKELYVRYRIDGRLHDAMVLPKGSDLPINARIKALASLRLSERSLPQEGRFRVEMNKEKILVRVAAMPTLYGEKVVLRLAHENASGLTFEQLGFHGDALERVHDAAKKGGLVVVSGPADSGKATALYALVDLVHTTRTSVATIEDPIKQRLPRVSQAQARPEIGLSIATGLRSILRQDPDVVMVSEIRDAETLSLAANAALAGKTVFSGIIAKSAADAIVRLSGMHAEKSLLASTLSTVICQRLVRKLAPAVRDRKPLSKTELAALAKIADLDKVLSVLKAEKVAGPKDDWNKILFGSAIAASNAESYSGRVGIHEVLRVTPTIQSLIVKGAPAAEITTVARKEGMLTLLEDGIIMAAKGLTSLEEVFKATSGK